MRLLSISLVAISLACANSVYAQEEVYPQSETSKIYERAPGNARYIGSPAHQYRVARAQEYAAHRDSMLRAYEAAGIDYAHPTVTSMSLFAPVQRTDPYRRAYLRPVYIYVPMYVPSNGSADPIY